MSAPRLSDEQRASIVKAYKRGEPIKLIAYRFGIEPAYPGILAKRRGLTLRYTPRAAA